MHILDNVRAGMTKEEARRQALIKLGGITQNAASCTGNAVACQPWMRWRRTFAYSVRMLSKSRGFTFVAIITLALGIGVNTAVFTAFDALALRPRPVERSAASGVCSSHRSRRVPQRRVVSDYIYFRDHSKTLSDLSLFRLRYRGHFERFARDRAGKFIPLRRGRWLPAAATP